MTGGEESKLVILRLIDPSRRLRLAARGGRYGDRRFY
jgi:hypothetical protein